MSIVDSDNDSIRQLLERDYEAYSFTGRERSNEAHGFAIPRSKWAFLCDQKETICEFFVW